MPSPFKFGISSCPNSNRVYFVYKKPMDKQLQTKQHIGKSGPE